MSLSAPGAGSWALVASASGIPSVTSRAFSVTVPFELRFALVSRSGRSVFELPLDAALGPAVPAGSLAGTDPVGLVAATGSGEVTDAFRVAITMAAIVAAAAAPLAFFGLHRDVRCDERVPRPAW